MRPMTLSRLWGFLAVALPTLAAMIATLQSVDLAYHLRAGAEILDTRAIPASDTWTFTGAGLPWTDQQWGAQVLLGGAYRLAGWTGLVLLRALLVAVIFGCLFAAARRRGLAVRTAAWLTLAAFAVAAAALSLRPQLLGMALFAVVLLIVADRRAHPARLWAVPVITIAWANLHGSFFLAPMVLGLAWLEDLHDGVPGPHRVLAVAAVTVAAACVTPFGPAVWSYAIGLSTNPEVTTRITEWQRTSIFEVPGILFYGSVVGVAVLVIRERRRIPWPTWLWLAMFVVIGVYAARGIAWWALAAVPAVAGIAFGLAPTRAKSSERVESRMSRRLNGVVAVAIVLLGVLLLPAWRPIDPGTLAPSGVVANAPSGITAALRGIVRPGDRVLNAQVWGSWFEFAVPDAFVAIDSRIELFPPETWDAYDTAIRGDDASSRQIDQWGVTVVVLEASQVGLAERLEADGWHPVFADDDGRIVVAPGR